MGYLVSFIGILFASLLLIGWVDNKRKGTVAIIATLMISALSSTIAIKALAGQTFMLLLKGSLVTGTVSLVVDPLSAWFILLINFTAITGIVYGAKYMQAYLNKPSGFTLHWISYLLAHAGLLVVCAAQNALVFLMALGVMVLSAFFLVIFENHKTKTLRAGINYLIQSHIAIVVLTIAFIWVSSVTGSFSFTSIPEFVSNQKPLYSFLLMLLFFVGFGIKAGFVPFHTWLPHAHPAAPSHVSGVMSGILIKIGIYGILRMVFLIDINYLATGYFILFVSVITGVYGVMLALIQHNLKKLLAYHSIENIGIIGIGIGLGCIGLGTASPVLAWLGFAGALLHTLNHSLFKSLLFYGAGNIHQGTSTMNVERLGGLIKQMPHTAILFLIAALAICGLPPFNGFISEFIVYQGLFHGILTYPFPYMLLLIVALFGLVLIGGLAIFCFTKAFGAVFLGVQRQRPLIGPKESSLQKLIPMYMVVGAILTIGIFPQVFISVLNLPVGQFTGHLGASADAVQPHSIQVLNHLGFYSGALLLIVAAIFLYRSRRQQVSVCSYSATWGCGYVAPTAKMQYTASSFIRNYRKLAEPLLSLQKFKKDVVGVFPVKAGHTIHPQDKVEELLINWPLHKFRVFMFKLSFLQNGRLQFYILYGMAFIMLLVGVPFIIYLIRFFVNFLNTI